jgi:hypothetical protein
MRDPRDEGVDEEEVAPWRQPVEPALTLENEVEVTRGGGLGGRLGGGLGGRLGGGSGGRLGGGSGGRLLAAIAGLVVLVGGTVFAVAQLGASGPQSPEAAVSDLLEAASDEDVLGLLAALDPGERDALKGPVEDMFEELQRLEVLDDSFSLTGVEGLDLEFDDVTFRSQPVRDDLVRVYFTGGTVRGAVDSSEIPVGDFVEDTMERFGADLGELDTSEESTIEDTDTFLVARSGPDGWRVSIGYTIAEAARVSSGAPLADAPIAPVGADSPEAAVESMVRAAADFDVRSVIAGLSPAEFAALQDYAGLFIEDVEAEMAEAAEEVDVTVDDLSVRSEQDGDRASVFVDGFAVTVTAEGTTVSVSYADGCFTVDGELDELELEGSAFDDGPVCTDDLGAAMEDLYGTEGFAGDGSDGSVDLPELPAIDTPDIGVTTTRIDGEWYVAPIATSLDAMVAGLEVLDRSHLDHFVDFFEELQSEWEESFTYDYEYPVEGDDGLGVVPEPGTFEDSGGVLEPVPGTGAPPPVFDGGQLPMPTTTVFSGGSVEEAALEELVRLQSPNPAAAECVLAGLDGAPDHVRTELAEAYVQGLEPSPEAWDALVTAMSSCGLV